MIWTSIEKDGYPVPCEIGSEEWRAWDKSGARRIKQEYVGDHWISTVFLEHDYSFGDGASIHYETMVFSRTGYPGKVQFDGYQRRYHSRSAALAGHDETVARIKDGTLMD